MGFRPVKTLNNSQTHTSDLGVTSLVCSLVKFERKSTVQLVFQLVLQRLYLKNQSPSSGILNCAAFLPTCLAIVLTLSRDQELILNSEFLLAAQH